MWRYFCPSDGTQFKNAPLDVEKLFVLWGETQFTKSQQALQCICLQLSAPGSSSSARQKQCTADVKCGPFATWDLALDIRQQCFVFVQLKDIKLFCLHRLLWNILSRSAPELHLFAIAFSHRSFQCCCKPFSQFPLNLEFSVHTSSYSLSFLSLCNFADIL